MSTPEMDPTADIGVNCTNEEIIMHLDKMMSGSPPPGNVISYINPHEFNPSYLPDGIWYLIRSKENIDTKHGLWKARGEACEIFSNFLIIGWMTTLEFYEGQVPHDHKTDWVMQEFRITEKRPSENSEAKEAGSLCRVFLGIRQSPNHEKQQNTFRADTSRETQSHSTQLIFLNADNDSRQGSTSKSQAKKDDKTGELPVTERLPNHHVENLPQIDYPFGDDYLELLDLDNPASSSSSSSSSSRLTTSSDECFDSLALLQDLESEINRDLVKKDAGYKFRVSAPNEVVMSPAISGSRISIRRSELPVEEIVKTDCSVPGSAMGNRNLDSKVLKHVVGNQKEDYRDEGPSSCGHKAAPNGERNEAVGRMRKLKKKYFCFMQVLDRLFISHV